jgi:predicted transcriptional regulator
MHVKAGWRVAVHKKTVRIQRFHGDKPRQQTEEKPCESKDSPLRKALRGAAMDVRLAREPGEKYTREEIEAKIARGLAQLEAGEGVDGEEFFEQLRKRGQELPS